MAKRGGLTEEDIVALDELSARLAVGNYYELLGVAPDASRAEIRTAFFALSKRFHPDRFFRADLGARHAQVDQVFSALSRAYETLSRSAVRRMYDAQLDDDVKRTDPVPLSAEAVGQSTVASGGSPRPQSRPVSHRSPSKPTGPARHLLRQLATGVRSREAKAAAQHRSVVPPAPSGRSAAHALARELIHHASGDELRLRSHLKAAEQAEQEERWSDAYRHLTMAQRIAPNEVVLIRRLENAHHRYLVQQVPQNREAAEIAEGEQNHVEAAMRWVRVAEATGEADDYVHAARCYLKSPRLAEQAKAGQLARRAVEIDPSCVKARKVLLEFFERTGMERSAAKERETLKKLKA